MALCHLLPQCGSDASQPKSDAKSVFPIHQYPYNHVLLVKFKLFIFMTLCHMLPQRGSDASQPKSDAKSVFPIYQYPYNHVLLAKYKPLIFHDVVPYAAVQRQQSSVEQNGHQNQFRRPILLTKADFGGHCATLEICKKINF